MLRIFLIVFLTVIVLGESKPLVEEVKDSVVKADSLVIESSSPKILVIYYSRTGNTKIVAENIAKIANADIERIIDTKDRSGVTGYIVAGYDAVAKKLTTIHDPEYDPADYDMLLVGTPVWAGKMATPIRTYLYKYKTTLPPVAFFHTRSGSNPDSPTEDMQEYTGKTPLAVLALTEAEIEEGFDHMAQKFIDDINEAISK